MDVRDIVLIVTGIFNVFLGFLIYLRNKNSQVHLSFTFFNFSLAGWALGIVFFRIATDPNLALVWAKSYYIAASFIAASLLYFANVFPEGKVLSLKKKLLIIIPSVIHALLIWIPGYLTHKVIIVPDGNEMVLGKIEYAIYTIYFIPFFYGALLILWGKYRRYYGSLKRQVLFVLLSVLLASIFGVVFNLILPWFGNYRLIYLGPPFTMIIFWIVTYAIIKHRFMDIRFILARTLVFSLIVTIIGTVYILITFLVSQVFLLYNQSSNPTAVYLFLTVVVALSFEKLKGFIEQSTDRFFFKGHYDSDRLLSLLANIMSSNIELYSLNSKILQVLISEMRITRGVFILLDDKKIYDIISVGLTYDLKISFGQIAPFLQNKDVLVFEDIEESIVKQAMRDLGVSVAKILEVNGRTVGLLMLGEKASGEIYSSQDLKVIDILAPEVAVAIQNSQSYDKIKKFNITLTQEIEKATKDLQLANNRLKELDKLKDDFVSVASHELRTPMTAIRSYVWMALNRPDVPLTEKLKKYLDRTLISTERLINLVNDMLNISRIESGRIEILPKAFDIQELTKEVMAEVEQKAKEKNLNLQLQSLATPKVFADPDKVHQVLLNLLGNAMKFTPDSGTIVVSFFSDGKSVETSIKDSGVGISREDQQRLFKKFGRLDSSYVAAATSGGTGLGLYICKSLVEMMSGTVKGTSDGLGKGATFSFALPAATAQVLSQAYKYTNKVVGEAKVLESAAI